MIKIASKIDSTVDWHWRTWAQLSRDELYALMQLRQDVFNVEQHCAFQDADGLDPASRHLLGWADLKPDGDPKTLVACARLVAPLCRFDELSIGRVVTARTHRNTGLGKQLMNEALRYTDDAGVPKIHISAQAHLANFYANLGFETASEPYDEDGIPHLEMLRLLPAASHTADLYKGLRIEPLRKLHAALVFEELADLNIYEYMEERPQTDLAGLEKRYARLEIGAPAGCGELWLNWLVTDDATENILGTIQATIYPNARAEIGYAFILKHWGKGIASKSLRWLNQNLHNRWGMNAVDAQVDQRNIGSWKALENAGFKRIKELDATLHEAATRDYLYSSVV